MNKLKFMDVRFKNKIQQPMVELTLLPRPQIVEERKRSSGAVVDSSQEKDCFLVTSTVFGWKLIHLSLSFLLLRFGELFELKLGLQNDSGSSKICGIGEVDLVLLFEPEGNIPRKLKDFVSCLLKNLDLTLLFGNVVDGPSLTNRLGELTVRLRRIQDLLREIRVISMRHVGVTTNASSKATGPHGGGASIPTVVVQFSNLKSHVRYQVTFEVSHYYPFSSGMESAVVATDVKNLIGHVTFEMVQNLLVERGKCLSVLELYQPLTWMCACLADL
eukprot:TRINITY_DN5255_c0_g1_i13.p2 TRINITY_DN5255_c0_g1~~TRINITY_DN5255_c0_g1_i13.p2  ORF type:complete len:274 (+),score=61.65 TRINITY_DN5255_c0_g1_i13:1899-2720(+)